MGFNTDFPMLQLYSVIGPLKNSKIQLYHLHNFIYKLHAQIAKIGVHDNAVLWVKLKKTT